MYREALAPWSEAEYLAIVKQCEDVITDVNPDLVVLDPICVVGNDAVYRLGSGQ